MFAFACVCVCERKHASLFLELINFKYLTRQAGIARRTRALFHFGGQVPARPEPRRGRNGCLHRQVTKGDRRHVTVVSGSDQYGIKRRQGLQETISSRTRIRSIQLTEGCLEVSYSS